MELGQGRLAAARAQRVLRDEFPQAFRAARNRWPKGQRTLSSEGFTLVTIDLVNEYPEAVIENNETGQRFSAKLHKFLGRLHGSFTLNQNEEPVDIYLS